VGGSSLGKVLFYFDHSGATSYIRRRKQEYGVFWDLADEFLLHTPNNILVAVSQGLSILGTIRFSSADYIDCADAYGLWIERVPKIQAKTSTYRIYHGLFACGEVYTHRRVEHAISSHRRHLDMA
jgi:hypothetical protein